MQRQRVTYVLLLHKGHQRYADQMLPCHRPGNLLTAREPKFSYSTLLPSCSLM